MKSKQRMKLPNRITAMLMSFAVVFALMLVIGIGSSGKAYAATGDVLTDSQGNKCEGNWVGLAWRIVETNDGNELQLGNPDSEEGNEWGKPGAGRTEQAQIDSFIDYQNLDDEEKIEGALQKIRNIPWLNNGNDDLIDKVRVVADIKINGGMQAYFVGMANLKSITGLERIDLSDCHYINNLFHVKVGDQEFHSPNLVELDGYQQWDVSNVRDMNNLFMGCAVDEIDCSNWNTSSVTASFNVFRDCNARVINISGWDLSRSQGTSGMFGYYGMFPEARLERIIGIEGLKINNCKYIHDMFVRQKKLTSLDLSAWDTSSAITMSSMFLNCTGLETLNLTGWDTRNVKWMHYMFAGTGEPYMSLTEIKGIEGFDTRNVTNMSRMFAGCKLLENLDLTNWDTSKVTDMRSMFWQCNALQEITGLENFDIGKVETTRTMFAHCHNLESTGMLEWNMSGVEDAASMLYGCRKLATSIQNVIDEKAEALRGSGASDDEIETNPEIIALKNAKAIVDAAKSGKDVNGNALDDNTWLDAMKEAAKRFATGIIEDKKTEAAAAIEAARQAEENAASDPQAAREVLEAAHKAVKNVKALAGFTDKSKDKSDANALEQALENGAEKKQKNRVKAELENLVNESKSIDLSQMSAIGAKRFEEALTKAEEVLSDPASKAENIQEALEELAEAKAGLKQKSAAERAYDEADKAAEEAVAAADKAKAAYEAAKAKADEAKTKAEEAKAKAEQTGNLKDIEDAVKAAEEYKNAAADAKKAAEESEAKAIAATEAMKAAKAEAEKTGDSDIIASANDKRIVAAQNKNRALDENAAAGEINAEAAAAYAEQLDKAVEKETDPVKKAELANKAAEAWKDAAGKAEATGNTELNAKAAEAGTKAEGIAQTTSDAALTTTIADAKKVDTSNATPESKKALEDAIANAEKVLADPASTPEQKAAAAKAVAEAQKNLTNVDVKPGDQFVFNNQKYEVLTVPANGNGTAALVKGRNAKSVTVPKTASYTEKGKTFDVTEINTKAFYKKTRKVTVGANVDTIDKQAFKGSKVATVVLKTKDLTKKSVKGSLKSSKVKTVQVKVGSKKVNKKFVKKYKKIFTKKNAGKKVTVK